jgi:hypothetical protein
MALGFLVPKFNLGTRKRNSEILRCAQNDMDSHLHTAPWLPELTWRL